MIHGIGNDLGIRCGSRPLLACLFYALALSLICSAPLGAQLAEGQAGTLPQDDPSRIPPVAVETLAARLAASDLNPDQRAGILAELEARREALMGEYLAEYRKTIRDNHRLHPEDPWLASEKIEQALRSIAPLIKQHNQLADFLDEHAPVIRPDTGLQLRAHLSKLPAAHREFIEATKAALLEPATSFQPIASAQARLQADLAEAHASEPAAVSRPLRDTPQRQAHLRRLHQNLLETDPENTPPLAEFLHSQRVSRFNVTTETNPTKP